jgi:hypothetical protein
MLTGVLNRFDSARNIGESWPERPVPGFFRHGFHLCVEQLLKMSLLRCSHIFCCSGICLLVAIGLGHDLNFTLHCYHWWTHAEIRI